MPAKTNSMKNTITTPEEETRGAAEEFAQSLQSGSWRDREAGFLAGVEWHTYKLGHEVANLRKLAAGYQTIIAQKEKGLTARDAEIERLNRQFSSDREEFQRIKRIFLKTCDERDAAREREKKALAVIKDVIAYNVAGNDLPDDAWKRLNEVAHILRMVHDPAYAADGKEGA